MSNLLKNLLVALGLVILLWLGYMLFLKDDGDVATNKPSQDAALQTQEFLTKLQLLRSLKIDDAIFSDIRFTSLVDLRQELEPETIGRPNPFAPVR